MLVLPEFGLKSQSLQFTTSNCQTFQGFQLANQNHGVEEAGAFLAAGDSDAPAFARHHQGAKHFGSGFLDSSSSSQHNTPQNGSCESGAMLPQQRGEQDRGGKQGTSKVGLWQRAAKSKE
jgi:hypothetical protein